MICKVELKNKKSIIQKAHFEKLIIGKIQLHKSSRWTRKYKDGKMEIK